MAAHSLSKKYERFGALADDAAAEEQTALSKFPGSDSELADAKPLRNFGHCTLCSAIQS